MNRLNQKIYDISTLLLLFLTICLVCTKLLFYFGGKESKYLFLVYTGGSIALYCFLRKESIRDKVCTVLIFIIILSGVIWLNIKVFDFSYDGCGYHEMGIGLMAHGWNPIKESADIFIESEGLDLLGNSHAMWIDHYASGTWTIASIFYTFTGYIESGKAINLLSVFILFGIINFYVAKWKGHSGLFNYMFAFLCTVNPITLAQLFTNYVDGILGLFMELGILSWFIILKGNTSRERLNGFLFLLCSILFCSNIKVSGFFFIGIYTIIAYAIILFRNYKNRIKFKQVFTKLTILLAGMVFFAVCIIGYHPYITNLIQHRNPIYPIMSEINIMDGQYPKSFEGKGNTQRAIVSLFSKVDSINSNDNREPVIKIPFTVSKEEIQRCSYDTRISGFGPWFSGIFIVSFIYLIYYFGIKKRELDERDIDNAEIYFIVIMIMNVILTLFFEGSWWARFSMYEYFIPLGVLYLMIEDKGIIKAIFCFLFLVNNFFFCRNYIGLFSASDFMRTNLEYLSDVSQKEEMEICSSIADWSGSQFNFEDYGIIYSISNEKFEDGAGGIGWGYTYSVK